MNTPPKHYKQVEYNYPDYMQAVENLGKSLKEQGPLQEKQCQLIQ